MSLLPAVAHSHHKPYPSDLSDQEWAILKPLLPQPKGFGHPIEVDFREILNGIFYVQCSGCQWEMLPHDLPPYSTVYHYFQKWHRRGIWQQMHDQLRMQVRHRAIADSQSVKTTEKKGEVYGFDGGKKVRGRKRHIVVDSQGLVIGVLVSEDNAPERLGAIIVLDEAVERLKKLQVIWVDEGYSGKTFAHVVQQVCGEQVRVEVNELPRRKRTGYQNQKRASCSSLCNLR